MGRHKEPIEDRLLAKREIDPETGCWNYTGTQVKGYGRIWLNGKTVASHRASYEHWVGPIPEGLHIDHLCRNPPCFNPAHLEPVTCQENLLRGDTIQAANAAKTHCKRGHLLTGDNLYIHPKRGHRECRICRNAASAIHVRLTDQRTCSICGGPFTCLREKKTTHTCSPKCRGRAISESKRAKT